LPGPYWTTTRLKSEYGMDTKSIPHGFVALDGLKPGWYICKRLRRHLNMYKI
jgi:hypothetical protein